MLDAVQQEGLLAAGRAVIVLYSGGRDSTCLLDLASRIAGAGAVTALHVNYGLRDAAAADERHCAQTCDRLEIPLHIHHPKRPETGNLQAWARDVRYAAATELAQAAGAHPTDVAAGHTATDQVETILYRLASSPSRRALLGMRPREGNLIRPLLRFTREQTAEYCRARGLTWREDESNSSRAYARGRTRHDLVPAIKSIHPAAEANILALAEQLRDEADVLDALVEAVLAGRDHIALKELRELEPALRRLVVQRLADEAAGGPAPGTARRADEVAALSEHGTAMLDLPHGVRAVAHHGTLSFQRQGESRRNTKAKPKARSARP